MTTEDDFNRQLDAHPDDWQTRLVFADWLEERDDPRAEGYRALGSGQKWPEEFDDNCSADRLHAFCYWREAYKPGRWAHGITSDWFDLLAGSRTPDSGDTPMRSYRNYDTRRACDDAAALAFSKLPAERRAELLNPELVPA